MVALVATMALFAAAQSVGHRLEACTSELVWVPDKPGFEVTHRFHLDDVAELLPGSTDATLSVADKVALLTYVAQHFQLALAGHAVEFEPVGAELDGTYVFVYQELPLPSPPTAFVLSNTLLQDRGPKARAYVNVRLSSGVASHTFTGTSKRWTWRADAGRVADAER